MVWCMPFKIIGLFRGCYCVIKSKLFPHTPLQMPVNAVVPCAHIFKFIKLCPYINTNFLNEKKKTKNPQTNLGYCRYCSSLKKLHECTKSGLSADWVRKSLKIMTVLVLKVGGSFSKLAVSVPVWKYQNGFIWMIDEQLVSLILKVVFQEHKQHLKAQTDFRQCFIKPKPNSGNILLLVVYTSLLIFCKHSSMFSSSTVEDFFSF